MQIATRLIPLILLLMAACDQVPVSLPEPTAVSVTFADMTMMVGDAAPVAAQVVDQNGQVMQGLAPVFSTDNAAVATVSTAGMVHAVAPGTASILAAYGGTSAKVKVTVAPDRRGEVQSFEVLADSLVADVRGGVQSLAVRAENGYGFAVCPQLAFRSSNASVATARAGGACRIEIVPAFSGEATITVEAEGLSDVVRVRVTNVGATGFFSARPTSAQLVAGATVAYSVRMLNQASQPVVGQRVNLQVSTGELSATTVVTDSTGTATVQWTTPTHLRDVGQTHSISFRAQLPSGQVVWRGESVFIDGASLVKIVLYRPIYNRDNISPTHFVPLDADSITVPSWPIMYVGVSGLDQYGNIRVTDITFSLLSSEWTTSSFWGCGRELGTPTPTGMEYTCFRFYSGAIIDLRATTPEGHQKTLRVRISDR